MSGIMGGGGGGGYGMGMSSMAGDYGPPYTNEGYGKLGTHQALWINDYKYCSSNSF